MAAGTTYWKSKLRKRLRDAKRNGWAAVAQIEVVNCLVPSVAGTRGHPG